MDPNTKPDQLIPPTTVHQGGRVESAPIAREQHVESSRPLPELPKEVADAGVAVVDTAPKLSHTMFNQNPEPKVEIPEGQVPIAIQVQQARKNLDNNPKDSISWLGRIKITVLEKMGMRQVEHQPEQA